MAQDLTLREVARTARVSLGYLSEIERGQKEASSEILGPICDALNIPLSQILATVSRRAADQETGTPPMYPPVPQPGPSTPAPHLTSVNSDGT